MSNENGHLIKDLTAQMDLASANLEFEKVAELRDIIADVRSKIGNNAQAQRTN